MAVTGLVSGYTGYLYIAVTPTAGVFVTASGFASNRVDFSFTASQTATVGTFAAEVILGNGTNTYRWGTGSLTLSNSPALLGAGTVPLTGVFNWDLYSYTGTMPAQPVTYTNALAGDVTGTPDATEIAADAVGTNELDAEVRGLLATGSGINTNSAAWTSLVAAASAAQTTASAAGATGTAAYALAASANATGAAAHALAINALNISNLVTFSASQTVFRAGTMTRFYPKRWGAAKSGFIGQVGTNHPAGTVFHFYRPENNVWLTFTLNGSKVWMDGGTPAADVEIDEASYVFVQNVGTNDSYAPPDSSYASSLELVQFVQWVESLVASLESGVGVFPMNASRLGGYLPTDFVLITSLSNRAQRVAVPVTPTNSATANTYAFTNGYLYWGEPNGYGPGTNWGRVQLGPW